MLFEKPANTIDAKRELEILNTWESEHTFEESMHIREGRPAFVFFEGPPTANGTPHPGHVLTKAMKDVIPRYKTMCGYYVRRKAGWDTHGLPVELEVERQLGIEGKQQIENYGVEKFIDKCRESVFKYEREWRAMCRRGGFWIDMDDPYITCTNEYIESVWWALAQLWNKGLLYEGHKVVPYCPRCGTALSSHEVAQGYEEVQDPSIYVRFACRNRPQTSFLVWTTTPWTLISNVALAVGKDIDYCTVRQGEEYLILAKERLCVLQGDYEIVENMKGEQLLETEYVQLFPFIKPEKKAHYVIAGDFVSTSDGSGIVHIAPAFGEDDYKVGLANDLPVMQPVDMQGKFTAVIDPWAGKFVKDADPEIIATLSDDGRLYRAETCTHTYPFCWRCTSPLLYYARHSWFIKTTAYQNQVIQNNEQINWFPNYIKEGRFLNFLENMVDWAISRDRYWGTPLPIWRCACGHQHCVGSIEELRSMSRNTIGEIELHKPYVDGVKLICPVCQSDMQRVPEVIDCWFDSGMMHTAQWHYPFANQETFARQYPADFICEAVDQTRGWFYSLLVTSTLLHQSTCYKNVVVLGLICDKNGIKMSKSRGNVLDCMGLFEKYGADAVRWALYSGTAPWNTRRFYEEAIADAQKRYLGTFQNVYSFFVLYANIENFNPLEHALPYAQRTEIDRWILSRFHHSAEEVRKTLDVFEVTRATQIMETFVDDLSNWYVRRSRRRFWSSEKTSEQISAFLTLHEVLVGFAGLTAPFTPFLAEEVYRNLVCRIDANAPRSVHLTEFPAGNPEYIDLALEKRMAFIKRVVQLGRAARNEANLKVRQPLAHMKVVINDADEAGWLDEMSYLLIEELNIKAISAVRDAAELISFQAKPNFRKLGQGPLKGFIPQIKAHLEAADGSRIHRELQTGGYHFELDNKPVTLTKEEVELSTSPSPDYAVQSDGNLTVALHKTLTRPLVLEGLARELVNKIQFMRKEQEFEVVDRIRLQIAVVDPQWQQDLDEVVAEFGDYISRETLAIALEALPAMPAAASASGTTEWPINHIHMRITVTKEKQ